MRYVLGESGALVYDLREKRSIFRKSFDAQLVQSVFERLKGRDLMPQILISDAPVMNRRDVANLAHFQMTHYQRHFDQTGNLVEDAWAECAAQGWQADKICLYHTSARERELTREALEDFPIAFADAEETSLELSPLGVDKGKGLGILCRHLGIPMEQTIAVGDSYNDLSVLRAAGLAVAVGNAVPAVRTSCAAVVADNDHCGVAEAVERFLLK
jgi:HAD superfamily hydrolase (TIGR01484 family)